MATWVFSDVHGHAAPLRRLFERVSPAAEDEVICLGDMIDRGPDSAGVLRFVRGLSENVSRLTVLMGNHEALMLDALDHPFSYTSAYNWKRNGGRHTRDSLKTVGDEEYRELVDWIRGLDLWAVRELAGRLFAFVHAGVSFEAGEALPETRPPIWNKETLEAFLRAQDPDTLLWIREEFWEHPEGFGTNDNTGPLVIAGHTPAPYLSLMKVELDRSPVNKEGLAQMVSVAGDKINIDCAAAAGAGLGQLLLLRLDDMCEFYEPIKEGE